jgi:hypothetical protein
MTKNEATALIQATKSGLLDGSVEASQAVRALKAAARALDAAGDPEGAREARHLTAATVAAYIGI